MKQSKPSTEISAFAQTVAEALELTKDAQKLGLDSPLATPYLLSGHLAQTDITAESRGVKLRSLLSETIDKITGKNDKWYKTILREQYLNEKNIKDILLDENLSESSKAYYSRSRKQAIEELASILINTLTPALHLEMPRRVERKLFKREEEINHCQQALQKGHTITITGGGGVGKTTLASYLANGWGEPNVFWFTVRPGFNDHVHSLAFALGYFFKTLDEPILWQEMLAQTATIEPARVAYLIRYSLQNLKKRNIRPLLCFDEVDRLDRAQYGNHSQIIDLLDNLRGQAPMLLIGQQILLESDLFCPLTDLPLLAATQMLAEAGIHLSPPEIQRIHTYTNGNPRLIELFIMLFAYGVSITELLREVGNAPPLQFFLSKTLLRLTPDEVALLNALAVFRSPAPLDFWEKRSEYSLTLNQLMQRRLVIADDRGGVAILPAYRDILYDLLPVEARQALHGAAALIRAERAAYTSAAYHLIQAGQSEQAILQWSQHRQQEINQGQAHAAYELFHDLDTQGLGAEARIQHGLICAELARLVGNDQQALKDISAMLGSSPVLDIKAYRLAGMIHNDSHEFTQARQKFSEALEKAKVLAGIELGLIYRGLGWAHFSEKELKAAWQEALRAQYEIEHMQGIIQLEQGNYSNAEQILRSALTLAEETGHKEGIAKTANSLLVLFGKQERRKEVEEYSNIAAEAYEAIGKLQDLSKVKTNLAMDYNISGQHDKALQVLLEAEEMVLSHKYPLPIPYQLYSKLGFAEAYLGKEEWDNAEKYILPVIKSEDTKFMADAYRIMGNILFGRGDLPSAEKWLQDAIEITERPEQADSYIGGYAWRDLAKAYVKQGKLMEAEEAKARAIELFTGLQLPLEVEKTATLLPEV